MCVSCSSIRSILVGAAWAAEDEEDPHSITGAKYPTTGADAAWAASCEDDTTSSVSLAIEGPRRSMICSTVCSAKRSLVVLITGGTPGSGEMSSITGASAE